MSTNKYRIIKRAGLFFIEKPVLNWLGRRTGQWQTVGDADWAAVYSSLENAQEQANALNGLDVNAGNVVVEQERTWER